MAIPDTSRPSEPEVVFSRPPPSTLSARVSFLITPELKNPGSVGHFLHAIRRLLGLSASRTCPVAISPAALLGCRTEGQGGEGRVPSRVARTTLGHPVKRLCWAGCGWKDQRRLAFFATDGLDRPSACCRGSDLILYSFPDRLDALHQPRRPCRRRFCTFFSCSLYKTGQVGRRVAKPLGAQETW
jgi:hypothetical protein